MCLYHVQMMFRLNNLSNSHNRNNMFRNNIVILISFLTTSTFVCGQFGSVPSPDGTFHVIPRTSFSCQNRGSGYYADLETGCQIYHMCDGLGRQFSYSCPNTTLFQQRMLICDHWYMVNCSRSENDYDANLLIGQKDKHFVEDGEYDVRTPRPDLLEQHYSSTYNLKNFKAHPAVQNAIAGIHYQKQPSPKPNKVVSKDLPSIDSATARNVGPQFTVPGQYSINFIRNLAGGNTTPIPPQKPFAQALQRQAGEKNNDRRNIKNEGNLGFNNPDDQLANGQNKITSKSNAPLGNLNGNVKTPSIYFEPPLFGGINIPQNYQTFTAPSITTKSAPITITTTTTTTTTTTQKPKTTTTYKPIAKIISPQSNQKPSTNIPVPSLNIEPPLLIIQKPSIDFELPPFDYPAYTTNVDPTDSPLKISLSTQKLGTTKSAPGPFSTTQPPKSQNFVKTEQAPVPINQGSGFIKTTEDKITLPTARILARPTNNVIESLIAPKKSIQSNEITKPYSDLLPPLESFKTYDDSTTQGPPIYYEWKWAVPAFDLEPPNLDSTIRVGETQQNGKSFQKVTSNPFGKTDSTELPQSRGPTARSIPIDGRQNTKKDATSDTTGRPKTTTPIHLHDYKKLQQQFAIPDYEFPLENSDEPSSFEQSESVNSFQVKIPDAAKSNGRPFYGENSKCPDCHPAFVAPGTCHPCIRMR